MPGTKGESGQRDFNLLPKRETKEIRLCQHTHKRTHRSSQLYLDARRVNQVELAPPSYTEEICRGKLQLSQGIIDILTFGLSGTSLSTARWWDSGLINRLLGTNLYLNLRIEDHSKRS